MLGIYSLFRNSVMQESANFPKMESHFKILGAERSKFYIEGLQFWGDL
jgi:hypothetical protein